MNLEFIEYIVSNLEEVNDDYFLYHYDIEENIQNNVDLKVVYSEQNYEVQE